MAPDDQVLIKQIVHRDQQAFLALYERYSSRVYTLIQHMIDDQMAAEEILQAQTLRLRQAGAPAATIENGIETSDPWGTKVRLIKV